MGSIVLPPSPNWYASNLADACSEAQAFCAHNSIVILTADGRRVCDVLRGHSNRTTVVAFILDPKEDSLWAVSAAADRSVRLWLCNNRAEHRFGCRRALGKRPAEIRAIAATSQGGMAVLGDAAGSIFTWQVSGALEKLKKLKGCKIEGGVSCLACSPRPGDSSIAVGSAGSGQVSIVDWEQGTTLCTLQQHTAELHCLRWSLLSIQNVDANAKLSTTGAEMAELLVAAAADRCMKVFEVRCAAATGAGSVVGRIGEEREVALLSSFELTEPAGSSLHGQKSRLWLAADWAGVPVVRRGNTLHTWLVSSGYGGALLAWRVSWSEQPSTPTTSAAATSQFTKLPGGHTRTIFSVRCFPAVLPGDDAGQESGVGSAEQPALLISTIGMDRLALTTRVALPLLEADSNAALNAEKTGDAEKKAWQQASVAGTISGIGGFAYAVATDMAAVSMRNQRNLRLAVGCGDFCIRVVQLEHEWPSHEAAAAAFARGDDGGGGGDDFSLRPAMGPALTLWQGIPAAVTALCWHPTEDDVIVFGCGDGSIGLAHCGKGTAIVAPTKHKAAITQLAWFPVTDPEEREIYGGCGDEFLGGGSDSGDSEDGGSSFASTASDDHPSEASFDDVHLLSLSSDGSLLRWKVWRGVSTLFPAAVKAPTQAAQRKNTVRKELGRARDFFGYIHPWLTPTCVGSTAGGSSALLGGAAGEAALISSGGHHAGLAWFPAEATGPVTHLASGNRGWMAAVHGGEAPTLSVGREPRMVHAPSMVAAALPEGAAAVTSLAFGVVELPEVAGWAAVGLADGGIQLWRRTQAPQASAAAGGVTKSAEGDAAEGKIPPSEIELVTTVGGHGGAVLTLQWIRKSAIQVSKDQVSCRGVDRMFLVSGSEDQSVRLWDLHALLEKRAQQLQKEAAAAAAAVEQEAAGKAADLQEAGQEAAAAAQKVEHPAGGERSVAAAGIGSEVKGIGAGAAIGVIDERGREAEVPADEDTGEGVLPPPEQSPSLPPAAKETAASSSGVGSKKRSGNKKVQEASALGAKSLLPPAPSKPETPAQQAAMHASVLRLAAEASAAAAAGSVTETNNLISAPPPPPPSPPSPPTSSPPFDSFTELGCMRDPVSSADSLRCASASLLQHSAPSATSQQQRARVVRAATLALWSGDVGSALSILTRHDELTADFVSCSAAAGRAAWEAASRAYAAQLEERQEPHLAAMHLLAVGDASAACAAYARAGMAREAATLAAARLPAGHPQAVKLAGALAAQLEGRGEWELAAAQRLSAGDWGQAAAALAARDTAGALRAALELCAQGVRAGKLPAAEAVPLQSVFREKLAVRGECAEMAAASGEADGGAAVAVGKRRYSKGTLEGLRPRSESRLLAGLPLALQRQP